ncbi:hypothetical protein BPAE_0170g00210 [Botrytis paeoniae]|uniref:Uncharacterized protein n=1 Tax=Botrytis paeoniae TaxID=278948 RepID=A0A4Z1FGF2_9HELO|nr:hypothetical protein BPAE_0170g00210 [Botrytis paeoniae]
MLVLRTNIDTFDLLNRNNKSMTTPVLRKVLRYSSPQSYDLLLVTSSLKKMKLIDDRRVLSLLIIDPSTEESDIIGSAEDMPRRIITINGTAAAEAT